MQKTKAKQKKEKVDLEQIEKEVKAISKEEKGKKGAKGKKVDKEAPKSKKEYQAVLTENDLKAWAKKIDKCNVFAIDTETSSLDTMTADLIGISLACNEGEGCYIPIKHTYAEMPKQIPLTQIQTILGSTITKNKNK